MKKGILIIVIVALIFAITACKSSQNCPAYGQNIQEEVIEKTV